MNQRRLFVPLAVLALLSAAPFLAIGQPAATVYKDPNCGCCKDYVRYLEDNGYRVTAIDTTDLDGIKRKHGVSPRLAACHTILVDGYVVEGHVPVPVIEQLLRDRPDIRGITLPGMPPGSPGMTGKKSAPFEIYTLDSWPPQLYTTH